MAPDVEEALRYLGAGGNPPERLRQAVRDTAAALAETVRPRWTWKAFPLYRDGRRFMPEGAGIALEGRTAAVMLSQCNGLILLLCTLGAAFDSRLRAVQARDMAQAVILDACGSAFVETGCDAAEKEIAGRFPGQWLTDRFSPGYGDLPLSLQSGICAALDSSRRLGVQATEQFLLNPAKSVTAVIGLSDRPQAARVRGCGYCSMRDKCIIRKGGGRCAV